MTVCTIGKLRIPVSGGFYLRVIPYFLLKCMLKRINQERPFVIYVHPWETYSQTPRIKGLGIRDSFIAYYGISTALKKLESLLQDFEFGSMLNIISQFKKNLI